MATALCTMRKKERLALWGHVRVPKPFLRLDDLWEGLTELRKDVIHTGYGLLQCKVIYYSQ